MTADDLFEAFAGLPPAWRLFLPGWTEELCGGVIQQVKAVSGPRPIAPPDPFRALRLVEPEQVRVVVFGQDPYPTAGHADGLAFSAGQGRPRSLARIFDVLAADRAGFRPPERWSLEAWAAQGVLLLNPVLTVEVGQSGSHERCGWQGLTAQIASGLAKRRPPPVFLLWGAKAQAFFAAAVTPDSSLTVLATRHPSYDFQRQFMAGDQSHFVATQELIDWWRLDSTSAGVL